MCTSTSNVDPHTFVDRPGSEYTDGTGARRVWQDCSGCGNVSNRLVDPLGVGRQAHHTGVVFAVVPADTFALHFDGARHHTRIAESTSEFEDVDGTVYVLSTDALSGFAIRPDGELVYVWSVERGRGDALVAAAVRMGALYLDCFDGYLPTLYARHGFEVNSTVPNWTPGGPAVVYMSLPGHADRHGLDRS